MKVAIVLNKQISKVAGILNDVISEFSNAGLDYDVLDINDLKLGYDLVCSIGGDGTILKAARFYAVDDTVILGINQGRLGFLSFMSPNDIHKLPDIIKNKQYVVEERSMLQTNDSIALNDIVVKNTSIRTTKIELYINDKFVSEYVADGLIISTPTGSTAYGLSAGGPILYPHIDCVEIVPICAHTMASRPLVIPTGEKILVKSHDAILNVACDGQGKIEKSKEVLIISSKYKTKLAFPTADNFYHILRQKLHWGVSLASKP